MKGDPMIGSLAESQRYLEASAAVVRCTLLDYAHRGRADDRRRESESPLRAGMPAAQENRETEPALRKARASREEIAARLTRPPALEVLCARFRLSSFERDLLLVCAGMELEVGMADACATAQAAPGRPYPTFGMALAALPDASWGAIGPSAPLRRFGLLELSGGGPLLSQALRIDESILHYLMGIDHLDLRLEGMMTALEQPSALTRSHEAQVRELVEQLRAGEEETELPRLQVCGGDPAALRAVAAATCHALGHRPCLVHAADIPEATVERDSLLKLWTRESLLRGAALVVDCDGLEAGPVRRGVVALLERVDGVVIVLGREPIPTDMRASIRVNLSRTGADEQRELWARLLGPTGERFAPQVEAVSAQFSLSGPAIRTVARQVVRRLQTEVGPGQETVLWDTCRLQSRTRLNELAQRLEATVSWEELVLPAAQLRTLRELAASVRQRTRVYETWGLGGRSGRGLGISALFSGPSGTGKTLAAEVLANVLNLDLYRIDLSALVSKYIGETEKNLRRVFDAAEDSGAVLLFDEADALFGKRSEVKDSHDRYANIEVSYLLQRMEAYRGLAILTTNQKEALDTAFLRRLRFVVQFPFPDVSQRLELWRRAFPPQTPTDGLSVSRLARLNVAGGNIRNIALQGAFLAADEGTPVRMSHLLRAARVECAKLEKIISDSEVGGWV